MAPEAEKSRLPEPLDRERPKRTSCPDCMPPCSEAGQRSPTTAMAVCGLLLLAIALVFGQTVRFEFVNFDDQVYVYENVHVQKGMTREGFVWAFASFCGTNWHPVTWLSHMLDIQLYGLWAGGHHLTNVLLHALSVIVLFLVLRQMTGRQWPSALVAALFAIHPLHVESVAWVAERKDVLSGLFFVLTLAAYLGYVRRPFSLLRYLLVVLCFVMGLLSKPMLVTLPLVLLLLDYWPLRRFGATGSGATTLVPGSAGSEGRGARGEGRTEDAATTMVSGSSGNTGSTVSGSVATDHVYTVPGLPSSAQHTVGQAGALRSGLLRLIVEKIPLLLLAAASCVATLMAQTNAMVALEELPFVYRAANAVVSYVAYLGQSLCPTSLAVFYPHARDALPWWIVGGCLLLLMGVSIVVARWRRSRPYLLLGWLWYLGMLVPVIGLVQVGTQTRADRYMYLPLVGPSLALVWTTLEFAGSSFVRRWLCGTAWLLVLVFLASLSWQQVSTWRNSEALWTHALACTTRNDMAHYNLGVALTGRGQVDKAIAQYQKALEIKPNYANAHNNLGVALTDRKQVDSAIAHYQRSLEIRPDYAEAHNNLGLALAGRRQVDEAIAHYQKALEIRPDYAVAHNNLAVALAGRGQVDEAITHFQKVLEIKPDYADAYNNLGVVLAGRGQVDEAIAHFQKVLEIKPDYADAYNNLAVALAGRGQVDESIAQYQKALEIKPDYADAHFNLASALAGHGQFDSAITHFQKALDVRPDYAEAHYNLGVVLAGRGQIDEAIAHFQKALEVRPDFAQSRRNLSVVLSAREEILKSLAQRREAIRLQPNNAVLLNDTAWMLATNPNPSVRNGAEAAELAQRALKLAGDNEPVILGTLAAAYAEAGRFPEAVRTGEQAVRLAAARGDRVLVQQIRTCLEFYTSGKPYRQMPNR